jgi:16S rRNA G966 N2-methylase RsmD
LNRITTRNIEQGSGSSALAFQALSRTAKKILADYKHDQSVEKQKSKRTSLDLQEAGRRHQDSINFDPARADSEPCPQCNHFFCMPVDTPEEVEEKNELQYGPNTTND